MAYKQKNYFEFRDSLASGEPDKVIKGKHFDEEFGAIEKAFENVTADIHVDEIEGLDALLNEKADQSALEKEIDDRIEGDKHLQSQIDSLEPYDDTQIKQDLSDLNDDLLQEIQDRKDADKVLQDQIDDLDTNKADLSALNQEIEDREKGDNAINDRIDKLVTDDLADVNSAGAKDNDFLIFNGVNWEAESFHIDTELQFKGGISVVSDPAPTQKENGDLYINNEEGIAGQSWTGIAGEAINEANAVGWSATNARWYILGDIASAAVMSVRKGTGIDVLNDDPANPVVSVDRDEVDKWYEPPISPKRSAFNKNFGTASGTVAEGDHVHDQYLTTETDPTVPQHVKDISTNDISRWDEAHGWGDHSQEGYLKSGDVPDVDQSDKISKTDTNDQQVVSNFKSTKNITAAKFVGDGSSLTNITTNQLSDVSSATAKKDDFLIHNGSNWVAEAFHIDTELTYQGAWNLTAAPPATKNNGDLYINNTAGVVHSGWTGINGTTVREGNVVGWAASKNRWYLMGDIASSAVTEVKGGTGITVNSDDAAKPIVNLNLATASIIGGVRIGASGLAAKEYAVRLNGNNQMFVSVPWTDTQTDLTGYATQAWVNSNFDNYGGWNLTANGATSSKIGANSTVDIVGSGNTTVSKSGNTITISSTAGGTNLPNGSFVGDLLSWNGSSWGPSQRASVNDAASQAAFSVNNFDVYQDGPTSKATFHMNTSVSGVMEATTVKKFGGTANQILCADGSTVDRGTGTFYKNVVLTEAAYNGLASKDANTIYFLT